MTLSSARSRRRARPYLQYLAAGVTGPLVGGTVDLLNPTRTATTVTLTYGLATGGIVQRPHTVAAYSSASINPATDDALLANTTFGVIASASSPFVMTGSTWWPASSADWYEGGATTAAPAAGARWALAGGESGGPNNSETEIAISNVTALAGTVNVRLTFDDGTSVARAVNLPAVSRITVVIDDLFPEAANRRFSATVETVGANGGAAPSVVVEHATYISLGGVPRAGGTRLLATPLP